MKISVAVVGALALVAEAQAQESSLRSRGRRLTKKGKKASKGKKGSVAVMSKDEAAETLSAEVPEHCAARAPLYGDLPEGKGPFPRDNAERLLFREGVIEEIPSSLCDKAPEGKNVILVVGDGMGWEMIRAGAVAKLVLAELESLGVDTMNGSTGPIAEAAMKAFEGRTLSDYYTEGPGYGLSFQDLADFALMTTTTTVIQAPNFGAHYAPARSLLEGSVSDHFDGMAPLAIDECTGRPIDFDPRDFETDGGNMVLWDDAKGGATPWDPDYYTDTPANPNFDKEFIMRHATDSASTAGCMATGHKAAVNMMSVDLYEEKVSTLVEDVMACGMSGGVVSSVPVLHATPAAFVTHSNYRKNGPQMQETFKVINPTLASGGCISSYQPSEEHKDSMRTGPLSNQWILLEQNENVTAEEFYNPILDKDPDDGTHVMVCLGGQYTASGQSNMPYRGLDSSYSSRHCSSGTYLYDKSESIVGVNVTTEEATCNHYEPEEMAQIPKMRDQVKAALDFMGKDDEGFFMMYEQGDIDWAAHGDHMDDMLGTMLDIDDSVAYIMEWIAANGGFEKNALYITADHDHYLTLLPNFPEAVANFVIKGESHKITPLNNSNVNTWSAAISAGRHEDNSKTVTEHIKDFATWTQDDIDTVGHFWGAFGSGGNGWGSHTTKPVPVHYEGDNGCIEKLTGKGFKVLGKDVVGSPGKIDQMHLHACMKANLFGML